MGSLTNFIDQSDTPSGGTGWSRGLRLPGKMSAALIPTRLVRFKRRPVALFLIAVAVLLSPVAAWASGDGGGSGLISAIGISIIAATVLAFLAYLTKQPLLLAYLAAGAAIGPQFGFGWVTARRCQDHHGNRSDSPVVHDRAGIEPQKVERGGQVPDRYGHFAVRPLRRHGPGLFHAAGVHHRRAL